MAWRHLDANEPAKTSVNWKSKFRCRNTTGQFNARSGQQPSTAAQPNATRQGQNADVNAHVNGRANGNRAATSGQLERRGFGNEGRLNASTREGRGIAEERGMRGQRGTYARVSEERYGHGLRGERGAYARVSEERYRRGLRGERGLYARESGYRKVQMSMQVHQNSPKQKCE